MTHPKHTGFDAPFLDDEERHLLAGLENLPVAEDKTRAEAAAEWRAIAAKTLRKKAITLRLQERDIAKLKARALQKGIPYQTLIASILHQYAEGGLKETV